MKQPNKSRRTPNMTPSESSSQLHGGVIFPIAAIVFLGLLFPRTLAFLPGLAGLVLYALWPFLKGMPRPRSGKTMLVAVAICLIAAISAAWSADPAYALERSGKIAAVLIPGALWITMLGSLGRDEKTFLLRAIAVIAAFVAILFIEELLFDYPLMRFLSAISGHGEEFRDYALNRSIVALIAVTLPVLAFVYRSARNTGRGIPVCLPVIALILPVLVMTQSQSAQLAFVAGLSFMAIFPVRCRIAWHVLSAVLCLGILLAPLAAMQIFGIIQDTGMKDSNDMSWLSSANVLPRLEIWDFVSRYTMDHFWIGSGIEATRLVEKFDSAELYQPGLTLLHPHNSILQIWMEFGLVGALLACACLTALLYRINKETDPLRQRLFLGILMGFGAGGAVSYGLWQGWWLGLIVFVAGLAMLVSPEEKRG